MNVWIGIDLGGTNIKAGLVDAEGNILAQAGRPTALPRPAQAVADDIARTVRCLMEEHNLTLDKVGGIGIGCPGTVNSETGIVEYSNNLGWRNFALGDHLRRATGLPVWAGNDANVAALGEVCAGSAKGAHSAVIITLGTGVGCGIVLDGRILTGCNSAASEFGHMVIEFGGEPCTCGRKGCLESYASATGLIRMTREAVEAHPLSLMALSARDEGVDGSTAFRAMRRGDDAAAAVVDRYISYLACGITNIINALQPEIISLGGGIAKEGDALLVPLREKVYAEVFGGRGEIYTRIETCTLGYKAGIIGAAMLAAQQQA